MHGKRRIRSISEVEAARDWNVFGVQVRVKFIFDISVRWSVAFWATVLNICLNAVVSSIFNLKETIMSTLMAVVLVGATLLPVPGWRSFTCTEM